MNLIGLDLDGTLEDSRRDMAAAVHRVRYGLGLFPRPDAEILPWVNRGMDQLYRACFDDYIRDDPPRQEEVRARYEADYLANVARETKLYPGIAGALERLSALGSLAVVTNKPEHISRRLLEELGVASLITAVVGGDSCPKTKPDPMVLQEAAKRCGHDSGAGRSVMIGDSAADIRLGRAFGASTVWCAWGYASHTRETPDRTAARPEELPGLVQSLLG